MSFSIYDASAPVFVDALTNIQAWLDKAIAEGKDEAALMEARLAPDMFALPRQIQIASDTSKACVARLAGVQAPSMEDKEANFAELKERCQKTIDFINSIDKAALDGAESRPITVRFPNGMGYNFSGAAYVTGHALPNFFFHVMAAYAILRNAGVAVGKPDYLAHLGAPINLDAA